MSRFNVSECLVLSHGHFLCPKKQMLETLEPLGGKKIHQEAAQSSMHFFLSFCFPVDPTPMGFSSIDIW